MLMIMPATITTVPSHKRLIKGNFTTLSAMYGVSRDDSFTLISSFLSGSTRVNATASPWE